MRTRNPPQSPSGTPGNTVVRAWDEAADGYAAYFEPRFRPWLEEAVAALCEAEPGTGTVAVPGCGTGLDLCLLAGALPGHRVVGIDPAPAMCRRARARTSELPGVTVRQDDGTRTDAWPRPCTAVLSCFTLQLLPDPEQALTAWMRTLAQDGVLCVLYWPADTESRGPFADVRRVLEARLPGRDRSWETRLAETLAAAGGRIERDVTPGHAMRHDDAATFWEAMVRCGPLRGLLLSRGEAFVEKARRAFLDMAPPGALVHTPRARLVLARRT